MQLSVTDRLRKRGFWIGLLLIVGLAAVPRLTSYDFSLPYVDHVDEPNYYLAGLEGRGLYDNQGYFVGVPPAYIWVQIAAQTLLTPLGVDDLAETMRLMRQLSVAADLLTLILIALTAWQALRFSNATAGIIACWSAGAAWAVSPQVLENAVYALPDPYVNLFTALALWCAVLALRANPAAPRWAVLSTAAALVAVIFKYPALPALLPGALAGVLLLRREPHVGLRTLLIQALCVAGVGLWLVFGYGVAFQREGAVVRDQGLSNALDLDRVLHNIQFTLTPLNAPAVWLLLAAGLFVLIAAVVRQRWLPAATTLAALGVWIATAWITSSYERVSVTEMRYLLPGTLAVCVLLGLSVAQISLLLPAALRPLMMLGIALLVWLPQWNTSWALAAERNRPELRVVLHHWFDQNLDAGRTLVYEENDKLFNPDWGGMRLCCGKWVEWFRVEDLRQYTPAEWRDAGLVYALIPQWQWLDMQATDDGRAYLADMLYLRAFADDGLRGPATVVLRFAPPQQTVNMRFGEQIALIGYDGAETLTAGAPAQWRFYWRAASTPPTNYNVFLHVVHMNSGELVAQADGSPAAPTRPTLTWDAPDETLISPPFQITLPADMPVGDYQVLLGLYDYAGGDRLPTAGTDLAITPASDAIVLATFTVQEP